MNKRRGPLSEYGSSLAPQLSHNPRPCNCFSRYTHCLSTAGVGRSHRGELASRQTPKARQRSCRSIFSPRPIFPSNSHAISINSLEHCFLPHCSLPEFCRDFLEPLRQASKRSPATLKILRAIGKEPDKHRLSGYSNSQYAEHIVNPETRAGLQKALINERIGLWSNGVSRQR